MGMIKKTALFALAALLSWPAYGGTVRLVRSDGSTTVSSCEWQSIVVTSGLPVLVHCKGAAPPDPVAATVRRPRVTLTGLKAGAVTCSWRSVSIAGDGNIAAQCINDAPPQTGTGPEYVSECLYQTVTIWPPANAVVGGGILVSCFVGGEVPPPNPDNPTVSFGGMTAQAITFEPGRSLVVGYAMKLEAAAANVATGAASGLAVVFDSASPGVCAVSGSSATGYQATGKAAGTCYITANQPGSPAFFAAPQQKISFEVLESP
jgi:hypothetical protein